MVDPLDRDRLVAAARDLEVLLRSLLRGEYSSLTVSYNETSGPNYCSVDAYRERYGPSWHEHTDWISPEERDAAIRTNSWWIAHWYPDTPVGFQSLSASSLPALVAALLEYGEE